MERERVTASQKLLQLYFIRHGETAWSLSGQHTGRTDIPLTAHGEDEARGLEPCLRAVEFVRVLTSPLQRARRTCELAGLGASAVIEPDLAEWDYGEYEGKYPVDTLKERPDWNLYRDGAPAGNRPHRFPHARTGSSRNFKGWKAAWRSSRIASSDASSQRDGSGCRLSRASTLRWDRHRSAFSVTKPATLRRGS